jgi:hypothetical protein
LSFFSYEFIYNGIPSSTYGLFISSVNTSGIIDSPQGSGIVLFTKKILRNPKNFLYGVSQEPVLEFDLQFTSEDSISAQDRSVIGSWLFGQQDYKHLQILQDDMQHIYFNCIITESSVIYVGNLCKGWKAHVVCDSPFAYEYPKTVTESFSGSAIVSKSVSINNTSADSYYVYPIVTFTTSATGDGFSITNASDAGRIFSFSGILANETITIDCLKQIISSDTGLMRVSKFNLNWFRLVPNVNNLTIVGGITNYSIVYEVARKVGG